MIAVGSIRSRVTVSIARAAVGWPCRLLSSPCRFTYSSTWSARSRSAGGIARPSARAVRALRINSNFAGSSKGKLPGRDVPARLGQAHRPAHRNGIGASHADDGNGGGRRPGRLDGIRPGGVDDVDPEPHELACEGRQRRGLPSGISPLDDDALPIRMAELMQRVHERIDGQSSRPRLGDENADPRPPRRRLSSHPARAHAEAEHEDGERLPARGHSRITGEDHSISSSARSAVSPG